MNAPACNVNLNVLDGEVEKCPHNGSRLLLETVCILQISPRTDNAVPP